MSEMGFKAACPEVGTYTKPQPLAKGWKRVRCPECGKPDEVLGLTSQTTCNNKTKHKGGRIVWMVDE